MQVRFNGHARLNEYLKEGHLPERRGQMFSFSEQCGEIYNVKTKHIQVKYHFIRDVLDSKNIELVKVHTNNNTADLLRKGLPTE